MNTDNMKTKLAELKFLGTIELSGKVIVSDPCYERDTWCAGSLEILPGKYDTMVEYSDEGKYGMRVKAIEVNHEKYLQGDLRWEVTDIDVGVDSGQAGIFDDSIYPQGEVGAYGEEGFYGHVCELTNDSDIEMHNYRGHSLERDIMMDELMLKNAKDDLMRGIYQESLDRKKKELSEFVPMFDPRAGLVHGRGLVSSSGFGDGSYRCFVRKNNCGEIVGVRVVYIDESYVDEED